MKEKKKEIFIIVGCLLVIVLSVTLAWFSTEILGDGKEISVDSANLKIIFTSGNGTISSTNIEPGWSSEVNTFTVKNESNDTYKYNIIIKDLVNTFVTNGYLVYKITSTDGGYNMSEFKGIPKSGTATDTILAYSVEIAKGKTHSYSVEFKYINNESVDQGDDMGKVLSGTLYIEKGTTPTLAEKMIVDNPTISTRSSFSGVFTNSTTGTLYTSTESIAGSTAKTVYYYAGNTTNNWVKFGGFYWRIIRTNADGSVRLLYSGKESEGTTSTAAYIGTSAFNSSYNDSMYVGYMYGTSGSLDSNRQNTNDSTIKGVIDTWYSNNLKSYSNYISTTAIYCNDREVGSGTYSATGSTFYYAPYTRLYTNNSPSYNCTESGDAFSASTSVGNGKLIYPIGLMTADEITFAGGYRYSNNESAWYYLNGSGSSITSSIWWWLLSPHYWYGDSDLAYAWYGGGTGSPGRLGYYRVSLSTGGVRPVISIKSTVKATGTGTSSDPYILSL